jgi:uncharacterized protein involved in type VI secretion and phage assembly
VCSLPDDVLFHALEAIEDDRAVSPVHVEQRRLDDPAREGHAQPKLTKTVEQLRHHKRNKVPKARERENGEWRKSFCVVQWNILWREELQSRPSVVVEKAFPSTPLENTCSKQKIQISCG